MEWSGSFALAFTHGFPFELDAVCVVDQAVEDGIGYGGGRDRLVPGVHWELAGDQGRAASPAIMMITTI